MTNSYYRIVYSLIYFAATIKYKSLFFTIHTVKIKNNLPFYSLYEVNIILPQNQTTCGANN